MRKFWDCTEVELAWTRALHENKNYRIVFPENMDDCTDILMSPEFKDQTQLFLAGHKTLIEYDDKRFDQTRKVKLIVGVSIARN